MQPLMGLPATTFDDHQLNLTTLLKHCARNFPKKEIVSRVDGGIFRYNYLEAYRRVQRLANALGKLGIKLADMVGVMGWNTHRYYELYFAVPGIGAALLEINVRLHPSQLAYICNHSKAKLIFVDDTLIPVAEAVAPEAKTVEGYVIMTEKRLDEIETKLSPIYHYEDLLAEEKPEYDWSELNERSTAFAQYTSGTTGDPKGIYVSHRALYLHTQAFACSNALTPADCVMQFHPMFHVVGCGCSHAATYVGAKLVFPGRWVATEPSQVVDLITNEGVTWWCTATAINLAIYNYLKTLPKEKLPDWSRVRFINGATEPPIEMVDGFKELVGARCIHGYGASDATMYISANVKMAYEPEEVSKLSREEYVALVRKQGLPLIGFDLKIVDEKGEEVPRDGKTMGEILIRSPWTTRSYHDDPRTAECFTPDGYCKTGDAGVWFEDNYVWIKDRYKDLIKSGGEWISGMDMEILIMTHPKVAEATVFGVRHPKWEERPLALIVPKPEFKGEITKEEILDLLKTKFAKWQLPDDMLFVDSILKTSIGKFDKKVLRQQYADFYTKK